MERGRPTTYNKEQADAILHDIANGVTLFDATAKHGLARTTVYSWAREHEEFRTALTRAREEMAHSLVDDALKVADDVETKDQSYGARLRIDAKWRLASKFNPLYGDRQTIQHDGAMPIKVIEGINPESY